MQNALNDFMIDEKRKCQMCNKNEKIIEKQYKVSIRIETDWITKNCRLSDIPQELQISNNK